jgi:hypothetical protein
MPGVFVTFLALMLYPPVDTRFPMGVMLGIFLFPVMLHLLSFLRRPPNENPRIWRMLYVSSSIALLLFAMLLILNGRLDKSLPNEITATVIRKTVLQTRRGYQYDLTVASWRPGRSQEHFSVTSSVFNRAVVGRTVTVEVHQGFWGMLWRGNISPQ